MLSSPIQTNLLSWKTKDQVHDDLKVEYEKFRNLVHSMRLCQKRYFETRSRHWLNEAKKMERQVDAILEIL